LWPGPKTMQIAIGRVVLDGGRGGDGVWLPIPPTNYTYILHLTVQQTFSILVSQRIHKLQMCGVQGADRNCLANAQLLPTNLQAIRVSTEITIISPHSHTHRNEH